MLLVNVCIKNTEGEIIITKLGVLLDLAFIYFNENRIASYHNSKYICKDYFNLPQIEINDPKDYLESISWTRNAKNSLDIYMTVLIDGTIYVIESTALIPSINIDTELLEKYNKEEIDKVLKLANKSSFVVVEESISGAIGSISEADCIYIELI